MEHDRSVSGLTRDQRIELVRALFERGESTTSAAAAAFRQAYPAAPEAMIQTAVFHVYTEGVDTLLEFIASAEMFLRDPSSEWIGIEGGVTYHLLYHIYNWHLFQVLLPEGKQDILEAIDDLTHAMERKADQDKLLEAVKNLRDLLEGNRAYPDIG